jgi:hypothetical protein
MATFPLNGTGGLAQTREKKRGEQNEKLLHDFSFIGQSRGAVKGWGYAGMRFVY